jgi:hypothetical protein
VLLTATAQRLAAAARSRRRRSIEVRSCLRPSLSLAEYGPAGGELDLPLPLLNLSQIVIEPAEVA